MVDGKTKILGVIGDPIEHTFSPAMHNAGLDALNLNYIYLPFHVKEDKLGECIQGAKAMGINVPKYGKLLEYRLLMLMDNAPYNAICRMIVKLVAKIKYADVKPSTLQSLERNELTEIDIFNGYIASKGKEFGVETPVNSRLTEMIHEIERKERPITPDNLDEFKGMLF